MDLISKYDLIEKIVRSDNEVLLSQVKHLLEEEEVESWDDLDPALKASIKRGLSQVEKGKISGHDEVIKRLKKKHQK
jgi:predicted transcriptional regulator